jgi:hypothetical protein
MKSRHQLLPRAVLVLIVVCLAGCSPATQAGGSSPGLDPREKAAAEATALIQNAEATTMVMKAQAMATALVQNASASGPTLVPATPSPAPAITPLATLKPLSPQVTDTASPSPADVGQAAATVGADASAVELLGVMIAPETGLIVVQFKAPPSLAQKWQQGLVYVVDEATGAQYSSIPIAPLLGALFGRPKYAGQIGYVMFTNSPPGLRTGSIVTVVLGTFKQEHVTVQ